MNHLADYIKERYEICESCTEFNELLKLCRQCGCWMPGKTLIKSSRCPLGFWEPYEE